MGGIYNLWSVSVIIIKCVCRHRFLLLANKIEQSKPLSQPIPKSDYIRPSFKVKGRMHPRDNVYPAVPFHSIPVQSSPVHATIPFHRSSPPNPYTHDFRTRVLDERCYLSISQLHQCVPQSLRYLQTCDDSGEHNVPWHQSKKSGGVENCSFRTKRSLFDFCVQNWL